MTTMVNPLPRERVFHSREEKFMQLDKKLIGHKFNAFTTTVEAGKIRLFCKAIGEEDPIYVDEEAAKKAGYRAIPAPPTYLTAVTNDDPDKGGLLRLLNV